MDFVSHYLIGNIIAVTRKKITRKKIITIAFFGLLPDIIQIPLYLYVGFLNNKAFCFPNTCDWVGFRDNHPIISASMDIPHSLFFLFFIWLIVKYFKLPYLCLLAYLSHILIDIPSHTGEWAVKFLYPFPFMVNGYADVWAWNLYLYPIVWMVLVFIIVIVKKIQRDEIIYQN